MHASSDSDSLKKQMTQLKVFSETWSETQKTSVNDEIEETDCRRITYESGSQEGSNPTQRKQTFFVRRYIKKKEK